MSPNGKSDGDKAFGQRGDAEKILAMAKDVSRVENQSMSPATLTKAQTRLAEEAIKRDTEEAAKFCEDTLAWLNAESLERALTPEQRIFAVSLVTINLRQNFPADKGGPEFFDKVSKTAWEYWSKNKS